MIFSYDLKMEVPWTRVFNHLALDIFPYSKNEGRYDALHISGINLQNKIKFKNKIFFLTKGRMLSTNIQIYLALL
jgi:hypothetical protein